jgi:hypothetical protein
MVTLGSTGLVGLVDVRESNLKRSRDFRVLAKGSAKTISVHPVEKHLMLVPSNRTDCDIFDIRLNLNLKSHLFQVLLESYLPQTLISLDLCVEHAY